MYVVVRVMVICVPTFNPSLLLTLLVQVRGLSLVPQGKKPIESDTLPPFARLLRYFIYYKNSIIN